MDSDMNEIANTETISGLSFLHAALQALSVIVVSEFGDKTFFIAAILAMRHSRVSVVFGAMIANALMFILTVAIGWMMTVIPKAYIQTMSSFLFVIFGLQMIKERFSLNCNIQQRELGQARLRQEVAVSGHSPFFKTAQTGWRMSPNKATEELEEAQEEIKKKEDESTADNPAISNRMNVQQSLFTSSVVLKSFSLTFLAEWGDRSQITTILLGASEDLAGVIFGGLVGHTVCTGFAAVGGHYVAKKVSLRTVHTVGGVLFLIFGVTAVLGDFN